jgi:hypothetical protein
LWGCRWTIAAPYEGLRLPVHLSGGAVVNPVVHETIDPCKPFQRLRAPFDVPAAVRIQQMRVPLCITLGFADDGR